MMCHIYINLDGSTNIVPSKISYDTCIKCLEVEDFRMSTSRYIIVWTFYFSMFLLLRSTPFLTTGSLHCIRFNTNHWIKLTLCGWVVNIQRNEGGRDLLNRFGLRVILMTWAVPNIMFSSCKLHLFIFLAKHKI